MTTYQLKGKLFDATVVEDGGRIVRAAGQVAWAQGWTLAEMQRYCVSNGWQMQRVSSVAAGSITPVMP